MTDRITAREFHDSTGVADWRVLSGAAYAYFRTGTFAVGARFVAVVADLAEAADHHPDVDLRYPGVTVRLVSHDVAGLSRRDARLAERISTAARDLGIEADPAAVQQLRIGTDGPVVMPFWRAVLGYDEDGNEVDVATWQGRD